MDTLWDILYDENLKWAQLRWVLMIAIGLDPVWLRNYPTAALDNLCQPKIHLRPFTGKANWITAIRCQTAQCRVQTIKYAHGFVFVFRFRLRLVHLADIFSMIFWLRAKYNIAMESSFIGSTKRRITNWLAPLTSPCLNIFGRHSRSGMGKGIKRGYLCSQRTVGGLICLDDKSATDIDITIKNVYLHTFFSVASLALV